MRHNKTADKFFLQNQPVTACGINNKNFLAVTRTSKTTWEEQEQGKGCPAQGCGEAPVGTLGGGGPAETPVHPVGRFASGALYPTGDEENYNCTANLPVRGS